MNLTPSEKLTDHQVKKGLDLIVKDGLAAEAMATLTGGAFLVALALKLGATNFQIGLLAAMPTVSSIFQLVGIMLVQKYHNRRLITVISSVFARGPLLLISVLPFIFSAQVSLMLLVGLLFLHYFFGSVSGCSWNSWMKDLVPEEQLGRYFSNRSRLIQILSVSLSFAIAFIIDYVKDYYPQYEAKTYSLMFAVGGTLGLLGVILLARTPEPKIIPVKTRLFKLFKKPLQNTNFRNLMVFNSVWAFAVNLAAPFFSVYMLKTLQLPLSYVVTFNIISQLSNILFIRIWGKYSDQYSNKSILKICAPIYLFCFLGWTFTTMPGKHFLTIPLLVVIYFINGAAVAGINLAMSNVGMKLAPKEGDAIVYLTARSMFVAVFAGLAPVIGGYFADFFSNRQLTWNLEWKSPEGIMVFHTLELQAWDFFFVFAFLAGLVALYRLSFVKEEGEAKKGEVMKEITKELRREFRSNAVVTGIRNVAFVPYSYFTLIRRKKRINHHRKQKINAGALTYQKHVTLEQQKELKNAS